MFNVCIYCPREQNIYNTVQLPITTTCFGRVWPSSAETCVLEAVFAMTINLDTGSQTRRDDDPKI